MSNLKTYFKKSVSVCKKSSAYIRAIPVLQKHYIMQWWVMEIIRYHLPK